MPVAGQLLIQIAADTKSLAKGTKEAVQHVQTLQSSIRAIRREMRLMGQIAQIVGWAQAWQFATQALAAAATKAKELRAEAEKTGLSVEELSRGVMSTATARDLEAFGAANERVWDGIQAGAARAALAVNDYVGAVTNGMTLAAYKAQRLEIEETLSILLKLKIEDAARVRKLNELLQDERDKAAGITPEDRTIQQGVEAAKERGQDVSEDEVRAELKRNRTLAEFRARELKDAEELAKAEEARKQSIEDMISSARQLALEEGKTARERAVAEALRNGATVDQAKEIDMWHERAEAIKKEAEAAKHRDQLIKEQVKRQEEIEQWEAQQAMDEDARLEQDKLAREQRMNDIVGGRGGVSSIEQGTQAAFSAIAAANGKRQKTDEKQLTTLQKIERNQRKGEKSSTPQTVEAF